MSSKTNTQRSTPATNHRSSSYNALGGAELEAKYAHGAEKYHYKCQSAVREIMSSGKQCPSGYEMYLKPYSAN
jgi:hypothetical protein